MKALELAERGLLPDSLIRFGIRQRLKRVIRQEKTWQESDINSFVAHLKESPIALDTERANEQHYEVPSNYFNHVLGKSRKYSACYWPPSVDTLNEAEESALHLVAERAELKNGMNILELGCGWGSFTLWAAGKYPQSTITAVSNSHSQRQFIERQARVRKISNIKVITTDMNFFRPQESNAFDRIISIEMFEHMRNYEKLLKRISEWLKPDGKLFVHMFTHKNLTYPYRAENEEDWMAVYFFSGGLMPSADLLLRFPQDMTISRQWRINGRHYSRTLEAWLKKHDFHKSGILEMFSTVYGKKDATKWFNRWRLFYLACSELFAYNRGEEWFVSHYLMEPAKSLKMQKKGFPDSRHEKLSKVG